MPLSVETTSQLCLAPLGALSMFLNSPVPDCLSTLLSYCLVLGVLWVCSQSCVNFGAAEIQGPRSLLAAALERSFACHAFWLLSGAPAPGRRVYADISGPSFAPPSSFGGISGPGFHDRPGKPAGTRTPAHTARLRVKGVDTGLTEIGGRDPLRHRRSRASPLSLRHAPHRPLCRVFCPE